MTPSSQPLPSTRRIVTGHNSDGKAIVARESIVHGTATDHGPWIQAIWSTESHPPEVNGDEDRGLIKTGITNSGTVVRVLDLPPKSTGMLHRSISLDYIYVLKGKVVLVLDDGSRTSAKMNDMVIQQATMHSWDNETDEWARLLCILISSKPPVVGGKALEPEVPFHVE